MEKKDTVSHCSCGTSWGARERSNLTQLVDHATHEPVDSDPSSLPGDSNPLSIPGEPVKGGFWEHTKMLIPSVLVMLAFYTTFVALFFFTYGKYVEKQVVQANVRLLVNDLVDNVAFFGSEVSPGHMAELHKALVHMQLPDTSASDKQVADDNKKLVKQTFKVILGGAAIALVMAVLFWYFIVKQDWKVFGFDIVTKSLLLLLVVAITELAYFTLITKNYRSIDPNKAKKAIVDSIIAEIKKRVPTTPPPSASEEYVEPYNPVTMSLQDWQNFDNTLLLSGGVSAGPSEYVPGGIGAGTVVGGHVRQNAQTAGMY